MPSTTEEARLPGEQCARLRIDRQLEDAGWAVQSRGDLNLFVGRGVARRGESERFKAFDYAKLASRDKANLDIAWLRDESRENLENLPSPDVLAREIVEDLTAALAEFEAVATALEEQLGTADIDEDALTAD